MAEGKVQMNPHVPLNRDEIALLALVADGRTRKEIAAVRGVSVGTVQNMMRAIEQKLGARTTEHAIAIVARAGAV
jgi:DNA-binding CsgD family transcriptional regulator